MDISEIFVEHNDHKGKLVYIPWLRGFGCNVCGKLSIFTDEWFSVMPLNTASTRLGAGVANSSYDEGVAQSG